METKRDLSHLVVDEQGQGTRLDVWIAKQVPELTRSKIQKLIKDGSVQINHNVANAKTKITAGDIVAVCTELEQASKLTPKKVELNIIYEDDCLVVINKPAGLVVHPGAGVCGPTLAEGLLYHFGEIALNTGEDGWKRPGIVHRLDKDTSGVMVCAKTDVAMAHLSKQFEEKTNQREYICLVNGVMEDSVATCESYFYRDPDSRLKFKSMPVAKFEEKFPEPETHPKGFRWAKTIFKKEVVYGNRISLNIAKLYTGRTHQIRIHSADLGMPVLGDQLYSRQIMLPTIFSDEIIDTVRHLNRQMLHGRLLGFTHPDTLEQMQFVAEIPDDFRSLIDKLSPYRI